MKTRKTAKKEYTKIILTPGVAGSKKPGTIADYVHAILPEFKKSEFYLPLRLSSIVEGLQFFDAYYGIRRKVVSDHEELTVETTSSKEARSIFKEYQNYVSTLFLLNAPHEDEKQYGLRLQWKQE